MVVFPLSLSIMYAYIYIYIVLLGWGWRGRGLHYHRRGGTAQGALSGDVQAEHQLSATPPQH